jgi:TRAP-type C4-dicarboxylate transport system permease small subunit
MAAATRLVAAFDRAVAWTASAALILLLGVVTAGIVSRELDHPFSWTDEMAGYLMVWLASLGWILATRRRAHIRIRFFQDFLPRAGFRVVEAAIQVGLVVVGAVVGVMSIRLVVVNHDIEAVSIPVSTAWLYVPLVAAGFTAAAQGLADLATRIAVADPKRARDAVAGDAAA